MANKKEMLVRLLVFFIGMMVLALGITIIIKASLGVSPFDVLQIGLFYTFGLTIGTWSQIVGFVLIFITYLLDKKMVTFGTILNMIFVGIFIDFFLYFLPDSSNLIMQYFLLFLGIIIMGMGSGIYIAAKFGSGPRDGLMLALSMRLGYGISKIKTIMEITVVIAGFLLGGPVFIGTLISAVFIGPVMQFSLKWWQQKLDSLYLLVRSKNVSVSKQL